ncbi:hypothetical protein WT19_06825 [Burkholderia stagnalis]|nr:hypothetical protein WT17_14950 [Burkholderia stagnalis]KVO78289.1 hypothetical protein WT19_06825 [Burkholderia stagnalis]
MSFQHDYTVSIYKIRFFGNKIPVMINEEGRFALYDADADGWYFLGHIVGYCSKVFEVKDECSRCIFAPGLSGLGLYRPFIVAAI